MKLLYQTHSPYARKVLVFAHEIGMAERLDVIHHETSPLLRNEETFALNPLGKVPVLICDDGSAWFDSGVICEYLDGLHRGRTYIPTDPLLRLRALQDQALATGLADAGIAVRWESERRPPDKRWHPMLQGHLQKIVATSDYLEAHVIDGGEVTVGDIAIATALSWIAFRNVYDFEASRPKLSAWYRRFCSRPSMIATALSGDTVDHAQAIGAGVAHAVAMG